MGTIHYFDILTVKPGIYRMPSGFKIEVLPFKDDKEKKQHPNTAKVMYDENIYFTFGFKVAKYE